jgi:hypothetical protein
LASSTAGGKKKTKKKEKENNKVTKYLCDLGQGTEVPWALVFSF